MSNVMSNCILPDDSVSQINSQRLHKESSTTETDSSTESITESTSTDDQRHKAVDVWTSNGTTFWQNDARVVSILDKSSGKWIPLVPLSILGSQ